MSTFPLTLLVMGYMGKTKKMDYRSATGHGNQTSRTFVPWYSTPELVVLYFGRCFRLYSSSATYILRRFFKCVYRITHLPVHPHTGLNN